MLFKLEPRESSIGWLVIAVPLLAIALTIAAGFLLFAILGHPPVTALYTFFVLPVMTLNGIAELLLKATPLVLCAVGLAIGFRANVWNIGAEGQLTLGAICAGGVALLFHDNAGWWLMPLMLLAGIAGGAAWGMLPALLKTRFNTNEILTSLMLVYIAQLLLSWLVHGAWRDPDGFNFPESRLFVNEALVPRIIDGTRVTIGAPIALAVAVVAWFVMARTLLGFQVKAIGSAPLAARYGGFSGDRVIWIVFIIAGALAGLAGMLEVAGPVGQLTPSISPGYGFTAIIVAFTGRLHPIGIVFSGLLLALSYLGGELVQIKLGMPLAVSGVFQGLLLFFLLACELLINFRIRRVRPASGGH